MTHRLSVPDWRPSTYNELHGTSTHWREKHRLKKQDRQLVAYYAMQQQIPTAAGRRKVSLFITLGKGQRVCDSDAYAKSTLDALVHAGLLIDDNPRYCQLGEVVQRRGGEGERKTVIVLTDVPELVVEEE